MITFLVVATWLAIAVLGVGGVVVFAAFALERLSASRAHETD